MDFFELDRRFKRIEQVFKSIERRFRGRKLGLLFRLFIIALVLGAIAAGALYLVRYDQMRQARIERIDNALATDYPSYESAFCRWIYGGAPGYDDCLRSEQASFARYEAAWRRNEGVGDLREHMISCFNSARNEGGVSWKAAAECSELDSDDPNAGTANGS